MLPTTSMTIQFPLLFPASSEQRTSVILQSDWSAPRADFLDHEQHPAP
jgi:hypothetical protein